MKTNTSKVIYLVQLALLIAIEVILSLTPLGYLKVGIIELTFLTIPISVSAALLGPLASTILGFVFGITSFIQCFGMSAMGVALLAVSPLGTFITTVVTRTLMGFLTGMVFKATKNIGKNQTASYFITGFSAPILNFILFMGCLMLIFFNSEYIKGIASAMGIFNPIMLIFAISGINGAIDIPVSGVVSAILIKAVKAATKKLK